ncbi:peroxiredoxin [Rhodoligotrophos ferricapiens]|uniref:peroxiredoxin n=1 Tax=Rhodoligotrophos ferricapiens TaxID=3069264 RepID=UPI00315C9D28
MTIQVGERLPDATFTAVTPDGVKQYKTGEIFDGRKVVVFAVPGAFTPTCHLKHLPGFVRHADEIKAKGVDAIACIAVNDAFVLDAWAKTTGADGKIQFLADGNADFTKKIGLELDGSGFGLGMRSKRYAMVVENGVVKALHVEPQAGEATESGAEAILAVL